MSFFRVISPPAVGEGIDDLHSIGKIELFYKAPIRVLQLLVVLSLLFGGVTLWNLTLFQLSVQVFHWLMN